MPPAPDADPDLPFVFGVIRYQQAEVYLVWVSMDGGGDDIIPLSAWRHASQAHRALDAYTEAYGQLMEEVAQMTGAGSNSGGEDAPVPDEMGDGIADRWADFTDLVYGFSNAPVLPLSPHDTAQARRIIGAVRQQLRSVPDLPDGFTRTIVYTGQALAGDAPPQVRLTPAAPPPPPQPNRGEPQP